MNSHDGRSVVLCKWQPELAGELLERTRVHVVLDAYDVAHADIDEDLLARAATVHRVSTFNALEELATVAVSIRMQDPDVAKVVSFTEFSQLGAACLADVLGVGAPLVTSVASRDKRLMKRLVSAAGVPTADFHSLPDPSDEAAVASLAGRLEFPVVVKPAAGFGTMSTLRAGDAADFRDICRSFTYEPALSSRQLIVESFVDGEELHVDAYWGADGPHFLFISRYFAPRLAVQRGECPQDGGELLSREAHPGLYAGMEPFVARVMDGLGVTETMIHLEVFRQADGRIVFSEIATRVGGGWIPGLISQGLGRSIWTVLADLAIDGRTEPPHPSAPCIGMVHLRPDAPGRIVQIPSVADAMAIPGVLQAQVWAAPSDILAMRHPSEWVVFAFLGADTHEGLEALVKEIPQQLPVLTVPVEQRTALLLSAGLAGGIARLGPALRQRGWRVVLVSEVVDDPNAAVCDDHVVVDWDDADADVAAAVARADVRPGAIVTMVESLVLRRAALLDRFGLADPSTGLASLTDKAAVRRAADAAGVFPLRWTDGSVAQLPETPPTAYPVVLKPAVGSGASRDAHLVRSREEFDQVIAELRDANVPDRFIVEEYLAGEEFSVDGYMLDGTFTSVFVADKPDHDAVRLHDRGLRISPPVRVPAEVVARFVEDLRILLSRLGLDGVWLHVEGRMTERGRAGLIEINPRPGGGLYAAAIKHCTGIDPIEAALDMAIGVPPGPGHRGQGGAVAIVPVEAGTTGIVHCRTTVGDLLAVEGVVDAYIIDGYRVSTLAKENFFAAVMVTGRDEAEMRRRAAGALAVLDYTVSAGA